MPIRSHKNALINPLDALPVLYNRVPGDLLPPAKEPSRLDTLLERPVGRTPGVAMAVGAGLGAVTGGAVLLALGPDPSTAILAIGFGVVVALVVSVTMIVTGRAVRAHGPQVSAPPPPVLARSRSRFARTLRAEAALGQPTAAAKLAALRADWQRLLSRTPPTRGRTMVRAYDAVTTHWSRWRILISGALLTALVVAILLKVRVGPIYILVVLALALLRRREVQSLRRRCTAALRDGVCPCCDYHLKGLPPGCDALPDLGPRCCPECAARWPLAPPTLASPRQSTD